MKGRIRFISSEGPLDLILSPLRVEFSFNGRVLGASGAPDVAYAESLPVTIVRDGSFWCAWIGKQLVARCICRLPPTASIESALESGAFFESFVQTAHHLPSQTNLKPQGWISRTEPAEETVWAPTGSRALPTVEWMDIPSAWSFLVDGEFQLNAAKSIGIAVAVSDGPFYLARLLRNPKEPSVSVDLARVKLEGDEWVTEAIGQMDIPGSPYSPVRLQLLRSATALHVGVDGELILETQITDPLEDRIGLWWEGADRPVPVVRGLRWRPLDLAVWRGERWGGDITSVVGGRWRVTKDGYALVADKRDAVALIGDPEKPSWLFVDIFWTGQPVGLVWRYVGPTDFYAAKLVPQKGGADLETVLIRGKRRWLLDRFPLWLEENRTYRLALVQESQAVAIAVNGLELVRLPNGQRGPVGVWTSSYARVRSLWFHSYEEPLLPLSPEDGGVVMPKRDEGALPHELVSLTLPLGLPTGLPQIASLSQLPVWLVVERRSDFLHFSLYKDDQVWAQDRTRLTGDLPVTVDLERRGPLVLVRVGKRVVVTKRLDRPD